MPLQLTASLWLVLAVGPSIAPAPPPESAAIAALLRDAGRSDNRDSVVQAFWSRLGNRSPLVEPAGDSLSVVTFLWNGDSATRTVAVITPRSLADYGAGQMAMVPGTTLWYRSMLVRNDTRWLYRLAPNDIGVPLDQETHIVDRMRLWRRDPHNPAVFDYGAFGTMSILVLPHAPVDYTTAAEPPTSHGIVDTMTIPMRELGGVRPYWVYRPAGYAAHGRPYPLVIMSDGDSYTKLMQVSQVLDHLISRRLIRPVVAVFVANPGDVRERDLACNPAWEAFLIGELLPAVRTRYAVTRDRAGTIVGGYSLGGLAAACAAVRHSEVFGGVFAQSGSFYRAPAAEAPEWVARQVARGRHRPLRWYLDVGLLETGPIPSRDPSMLTASRHLRDVLAARGESVSYHELSSGHELVAWRATLASALVTLVGK